MLNRRKKTKKNRLRPVEDMDLFDEKLTVRFGEEELKKRNDFVYEYEVCQVCEKSRNLDSNHHAKYGLGSKDDRYLICICVSCHDILHRVGYEKLNKTREDCKSIGWGNHLEYMEIFHDV